MTISDAVVQSSPYSVRETIDRLEATLRQKGATIYARIDQQAEMQTVGRTLLPLDFLLFGNPLTGGAVLAENPAAALDLPLKAIAWEDAQHRVWLAFNEAAYIGQRYGLSPAVTAPLDLRNLVTAALSAT